MKTPHRKPALASVLFGLSITTTLVFGVWGFYELSGDSRFLNLFYKSIQLFSLESGSFDGQVPWQLELARWLAALTLLGGLLELVKSLLGEKYLRWKIRRFNDHHIVGGLNERGYRLALDLLDEGERVIALDSSPDTELLERFKSIGGVCIMYDISPTSDYRSIGLPNASTFTAVTNDDSLNLASAYAAEESKIRSEIAGRLAIHAHVGDVTLSDLLERNSFFVSENGHRASVRTFNSFANMARLILNDYPLETAGFPDGGVNTDREIHVIMPGPRPEAIALFIQAAKVGHYLGGRQVHFHVISEIASEIIRDAIFHYPFIEKCCASLSAVEPHEETGFGRAAGKIINSNGEACFTVIPCFDPKPRHLQGVIRLHEEVCDDIPYRLLLPLGLKDFLDSAFRRNSRFPGEIRWFSGESECCNRRMVFNEDLDRIARSIHERWIEETTSQIRSAESLGEHEKANRLRAKPSYKPWQDLTEDQKSANRSQADHAAIKIRAAGLDPHHTDGDVWKSWCDSHEDGVEWLARIEHERWSANLLIGGWSYGSQRDDSKKLHNNLVSFDKLDAPTKNYDAEAVRNISGYLCLHR